MAQIPCFVVSLVTATQRRESMQRLLAQHGIAPQWFDAVDGRAMSADDMREHFAADIAARVYGPMSRSEIGCALSHLGVYRRMVDQNVPCAVVLEDDALLAEDFPCLLDDKAGLASACRVAEPIMVQLTHVERGYRFGAHTIGTRAIVLPHGGVWLTSGYFITLAAAKQMVEHAYPVCTVADHWRYFEQAGLVRLYALTPNAVWESPHSQDSAIAPERQPRVRAKRSVWDYLRRVWDLLVVRKLFVKKLPRYPAGKI
jgi:glycosyl transferase family 25